MHIILNSDITSMTQTIPSELPWQNFVLWIVFSISLYH